MEAVGGDPLAVGTNRQVDDWMVVAPQHGERPARGRVPLANLVPRADDESPAIRREACGERPHGPTEDGERPARGRIPDPTGLPIQRAEPPSIRAVSQPLDPFPMPAQHRHFSARSRVPETNGLVVGAGGQALAVGTVGQRINGAVMPAQDGDRRPGRRVPDVDGALVPVGGSELLSGRAEGRQWQLQIDRSQLA